MRSTTCHHEAFAIGSSEDETVEASIEQLLLGGVNLLEVGLIVKVGSDAVHHDRVAALLTFEIEGVFIDLFHETEFIVALVSLTGFVDIGAGVGVCGTGDIVGSGEDVEHRVVGREREHRTVVGNDVPQRSGSLERGILAIVDVLVFAGDSNRAIVAERDDEVVAFFGRVAEIFHSPLATVGKEERLIILHRRLGAFGGVLVENVVDFVIARRKRKHQRERQR